MISWLRGKIIEKNPTSCVLDCQGLGFYIQMPLSTSHKIGEKGTEATFYIETLFSHDGVSLYGFATGEEREVFNSLIQVPGIGPKAALNLLSRFEANEAKKILSSGKVEILKTIPGIGPKKAEMIAFKLKGKSEKIEELSDKMNDALKALLSLGITRKEAKERLQKISNINDLTLTEILKKALSNAKP